MKGEIIIVGMGPGPVKFLTHEAKDILLAEQEIYFRMSRHPVYQWLRGYGIDCISFDPLYALPGVTYDKVYRIINKTLIMLAASRGKVVYALPGNPVVFEKTPVWMREEAAKEGVSVRVVIGLSFLEVLYHDLEIDPEAGLQVINGFNFGFYGDYPFTEKLGLLIGQVGFPTEKNPSAGNNNVEAIMKALLKKFPPDHPVTLVWSTGMPAYENRKATFALADLPKQKGYVRNLATLYVPPIKPPWEWVKKSPADKKTAAKISAVKKTGKKKAPGKKPAAKKSAPVKRSK